MYDLRLLLPRFVGCFLFKSIFIRKAADILRGSRVEYAMKKGGHTVEQMIMGQTEIARYNAALRERPGRAAQLYALQELLRPAARSELYEWITGRMPEEREYYRGQERLSRQDWEQLCEDRALDAAALRIEPRCGVCVRRSSLRALPTGTALTVERDDRYDDCLQLTAVLPGEPMALFHMSADGRWCFAASESCMGWIAAEDVAECSLEELQEEAERSFLLVTGSRITLCADPYEPEVSGVVLTMGTRLHLASQPGTVRAVRGRMSYDTYIAELPVRGADGRLEHVEALVPVSADVHVGYLPYSHEAVGAQAEKLRGEVYGWGGMLGARDCSALVGEVYRCFGFRLPRDSSGLAMLPGAEDISALSAEEKRALLRTLPIGTILYFPGHVMLYRGEADGEPLCLSAAGNFLPPGSAGGRPRAVNTVAVTPLSVVRANGKTWLESLTKIIRIP